MMNQKIEQITKTIEDKDAVYSKILLERPDDEWLKGYIAGLREAKIIVIQATK